MIKFLQPDVKRDWKNFCDYIKDKSSQLEMQKTKVRCHHFYIELIFIHTCRNLEVGVECRSVGAEARRHGEIV